MKYYFQMVFATFLFAGAFIAGKLGANDFTPIVMTFLRIGLASLILFPYMIFKEKSKWRASKSELKLALVLGLVGMTFYHLFFFSALKYTSVTNASVINASMPIITAILAVIFIKEKIALRKVIFIVTAFIGVVLTLIGWDFSVLKNLDFNKGDLLMLCGTISWSTYGILIKKGIHETSALKLTAYTLLMCTLIVSPFALKSIIFDGALQVSMKSYYTILYMAIFPTVIGYTVQQNSIKNLGPSISALFINLVPLFSILLSVIILNERVQPLTYVSASIIVFSVYKFVKA